MYRSEISKPQLENLNLIERLVVIILPNYFYEYESVLQHLVKENFGIVEKSVKNFKPEDVLEWKSADLESQDIWGLSDRLSDGPCMLLLCQRANAFIEMTGVARYHNAIANRMSSKNGIYYSKTTIAAYHDTLFFYPKYVDEKLMIKHAKDYLSVEVWPKLSQGLARLAVERPANPIVCLISFFFRPPKSQLFRNG
ncbi:Protein CBG05895 [Caenorhabditis briggsae]|uniref:Protein CBG05895 n=1 Tax=Caenorhabditis briggsae TaxID=6238 RepID=A8X1E1_CAEBR|nr:Protein CBG05895 [Caenorhabditis briggsae]CAP26451.2 Protein CBG05895 [Caenorhabditis briggsae]